MELALFPPESFCSTRSFYISNGLAIGYYKERRAKKITRSVGALCGNCKATEAYGGVGSHVCGWCASDRKFALGADEALQCFWRRRGGLSKWLRTKLAGLAEPRPTSSLSFHSCNPSRSFPHLFSIQQEIMGDLGDVLLDSVLSAPRMRYAWQLIEPKSLPLVGKVPI